MATLQTNLNDLLAGDITLQDGVNAQLTRQTYINPYVNDTNYQQFVPIIYFNIIANQISISNTRSISFSSTDIYTEIDWVILNKLIV